MTTRAHVYIYGDVTGVGYRSWTQRLAQGKFLTGWVRNYDQKTVEAVFEGEKERVEEMIKLCRKGPDVSWVDKVDVIWEEAKNALPDFRIID